MFYVGLDIHSNFIVICVLNEYGKVVRNVSVRQIDQMLQVLRSLPGPFQVCYEASCGYGRLFELLSPVAERVAVGHPGELRWIYRSKRKNDRIDAEKLAKLLYLDAVPLVHVPRSEVRAWRETISFRRSLIEKRTRAKNGLRALLRNVGVTPPRRPGLWTLRGLAWLKQLEFTEPMHALKRDILVSEVEELNRKVKRVEQALARYAKHPAVVLLQTIPGVGLRTAEAFVAHLDDPKRFHHSKAVGSYFGLVPSQDQSGPINRLGRITRQGPATVRQLLAEAAWQAIRRSPTVRAYFERVQRKDRERKKIALVATTHYLARVMWSMLKHNRVWEEKVQAA